MSHIIPCGCKHTYQDAVYGNGKRVHNVGAKSGKLRCTVCKTEKLPARSAVIEEKKAKKKAKDRNAAKEKR